MTIATPTVKAIHDLIFGKTADTARMMIMGDSQTTDALARAWGGIWTSWPLNWGAWPVGVTTSGANNFAGTSFRTKLEFAPTGGEINSGPGGPIAPDFTELAKRGVEFTFVGEPGASDIWERMRFLPGQARTKMDNLDPSLPWDRWRGASLRSRFIHHAQDVPVSTERIGIQTLLITNGTDSARVEDNMSAGQIVPIQGDSDVGYFDHTVSHPGTGSNFFWFETRLTGSNDVLLDSKFLWYEVVNGLDDGAGGWAQNPDRPLMYSTQGWSGARFRTYTDETGRFTWGQWGRFVEACAASNPAQFPNVIIVVMGINDGSLGTTPAELAADIPAFVAKVNAEYDARSVERPYILLVHQWATVTVDVALWKDMWETAYLPAADEQVGAVSIAEFQDYVIHSEHLDPAELHPGATEGDSAFFFGENGLLGAIKSILQNARARGRSRNAIVRGSITRN